MPGLIPLSVAIVAKGFQNQSLSREQDLGVHHGFHLQDIAVGVSYEKRLLLELRSNETAIRLVKIVETRRLDPLL
jgi:hypothetical protein